MSTRVSSQDPCPCGSPSNFQNCCEKVIRGLSPATSALALMRSRYSAFCVGDMTYLRKSVHPSMRKHFDLNSNKAWAESAQFERLEILETHEDESEGFVRFRAHYIQKGARHTHEESSRFKKDQGFWYFFEGRVSDSAPSNRV